MDQVAREGAAGDGMVTFSPQSPRIFLLVRKSSALLLVLSLAAACTQGGSGGGTTTPPDNGKAPDNQFGVYLSPRDFDIEERIRLAQEMGVRYFRSYPALVPVWNGQCSECSAVQAAGLQFILTIRNTANLGSAAGSISDIEGFKRAVGEILDQYKPALAIVENEEDVPRYFTGTADDYISELRTVCELAHQRGIKCANGGITYTGVTWLTYQHYVDAGQLSEAQSFSLRGLDRGQQSRLSSPQGQQVAQQVVDHEMSLVTHYKDAGADYMNIHWYPADAGAFMESVQYFEELTGLPVISNEIGQQHSTDPGAVTAMLNAIVELKMPIAVWFSSDSGFADGLVDPDGSLRSNGSAFASFVQSHSG